MMPADYAAAALRSWRGGGSAGDTALDEMVRAACEATAAHVGRIAAAYAQDRAEQYGACCRVGLEDVSHGIRSGAHLSSFLHGELDDIIKYHEDREATVIAVNLSEGIVTIAKKGTKP